MAFESLAQTFTNASVFITHLLENEILPTIVIFCGSRESLLEELLSSTTLQSPDAEDEQSGVGLSLLLTNTIELLALTPSIKIVYVESILHARAYLSTLDGQLDHFEFNVASQRPTLAIWGLIHAHKMTSEYTAQGVFRSLSLAIDAAHYTCRGLVVAECSLIDGRTRDEEEPNVTDAGFWEQRIPLLNQSIKLDRDRRQLAGQGIAIRDIVRKWCTIKESDEH